ncbi:hypothetical protein [Flavonifractor plautii]|uniref:hypothetical protein n=1 Tax=Flavonifractor plautii TaxID=292800 RepID=UPI003D7D43CA
MRRINWDEVKEADEFDNPTPGAYIAVICSVEDNDEKEYLKIEWDYSEGAYKGANAETFQRAGFWPTTLYRSYKPTAEGFFKTFKTALENSNPGYHFDEFNLRDMVGRRVGVVLGEEEYTKNTGEVKTRLYVYQTRSIQAIQKGDFKVPELKRLAENRKPSPAFGGASSDWSQPSSSGQFGESFGDGGKLPF